MPRISVLSDELINQIAAGEVVERPASVVKELGENALDAGAKTIRVSLVAGGLGSICIEDDGCGMSRDDAPRALLRHATSKIRDLEGLSSVMTRGFRGEALPAIASVSRFSLITCESGASIGTRLRFEGGTGGAGARLEFEPTLEDAPPIVGTKVTVDDLFYNTPARRKFMRRTSTELTHCQEALIRLALGHSDVSFFLEHEGKPLLVSPASPNPLEGLRERLVATLGAEVLPHLLEVDERRLGLEVTGYIAAPEFTLSTARGLYTFVNQRYIRDRGLNHAIQRAFREVLPMGRQPVAALFIRMDPTAVDVNVHPQKLEVRFADASSVGDAVFAAIRRVLLTASLPDASSAPENGQRSEAHYAWAVEQFLAQARERTLGLPLPASPRAAEPHDTEEPALAALQHRKGAFAEMRPMGSLARRFWVCEGQGGTLAVLDPHAVWERIYLSRLLKHSSPAMDAPTTSSLFSLTIELPRASAVKVLERKGLLGILGVVLEDFGLGSVSLSLPFELDTETARSWLEEVSILDKVDKVEVCRSLACHAAQHAVRAGGVDPTTRALAKLEASDFETPARHGKVILSEISLLELERRSRYG